MQLELKQIQGHTQAKPGARSNPAPRWNFERGRRTLGRSSDCDWQVADTTRAVSKLHCTIERDRDGFLLRDESANGTKVDGVLVLEGETARLSGGSRIEFGGFVFTAAISGEKDRELEDPDANLALSDESLTISAILADVSPGGRSATGILSARNAEDCSSPTPRAGSGESKPLSRNVDVGWNGPPTTTEQATLPNDWNEEFDYGNRLEHSSATHVSVPVARSRAPSESMPEPAAEPMGPAIAERPAAKPVVPSPAKALTPASLLRLEALIAQCEEATVELFAAFEIDPEAVVEAPDLFGADQEDVAVARLQTVLARQLRFNAALEGMLKGASHAMEPRVIEARVDAEPRKLPWLNDRSYWNAYRQNFDNDGSTLSVREFLRRAALRAIGEPEQDAQETTEKVNRTA